MRRFSFAAGASLANKVAAEKDKREMSRKMVVKPWVKIMVDDLDLFIKMACSLFCERDAESYTDEGDVERGRLWVFRGQADSQGKILSTLERHKVSGCAQSLELKQTEQLLYKEFIRESVCYTSIENKSSTYH